ncbi:MAG: septation protein SepH, partial [Mycobacterium sp.]
AAAPPAGAAPAPAAPQAPAPAAQSTPAAPTEEADLDEEPAPKPRRARKAKPTIPGWEDVLLGVRSGTQR